MILAPQAIRRFRVMMFSWWKEHRRDLPWRHTRDPYRILVSEVMLQQTQVSRVLPKYGEFIARYPTVRDLASASSADVLRMWKGLGYNRRALYLKRTAEAVVKTYGGKFPADESLLVKLPGLGRYTARAILVFAFERDVAMVDTNIRQIIVHFFFSGSLQKERLIQDAADALVPKGKSWEWHQSLMDYGALALPKVRSPKSSRTATPFTESNRYVRGKILDSLRESTMKERILVADIADVCGKSPEHVGTVITALLHDGLVVRTSGGMLSLPE